MVGAYALSLYREPRLTGDIDFFVGNEEVNESRLRRVRSDFGFGSMLPPAGERLLAPDRVIMLGRSPFRIDLLSRISGVDFELAYRTRKTFEIDGQLVSVISPQLLLKNKESAGRPKDLADAADLRAWFHESGANPDPLSG